MIDVKINLNPPQKNHFSPLPSQTLIVTNVISCFLSTGTFCLAITQISTRHGIIVLPNFIGFLSTLTYHGYLYVCAQRHLEVRRKVLHSSGEAILTPIRIIVAFLLVSGWVLILLANILLSLKAAPGAILTTVLGGIELFTLFFLAIKSSQEHWATGNHDHEYLVGANLIKPRSLVSRIVFLVSFVLSTVCFVVSVGSRSFVANTFGFTITVPYHLTIFIQSGKTQIATSHRQSQAKSVIFSLMLVAIWIIALILDVADDGALFQRIVSSVFGGIQCIVIGYLAVECILESLDRDAQVKLP